MGSAFKKTLFVFIGFIVILVGILTVVIQRYSIHGSIPDTMAMVDFQGILLAFLGAAVLSLISIVLTFYLARAWISEQPEFSKQDHSVRIYYQSKLYYHVWWFGGRYHYFTDFMDDRIFLVCINAGIVI